MIKPDSNIRDTVSMVESRPKADINLPPAPSDVLHKFDFVTARYHA